MTLKTINDELLKRYLLGNLSEDEQMQVQVQVQENFLADQEGFAQLKLIEDELLDDYVQNQLSREDRRRFETYYLVTPERRHKVDFAEDLSKALAARRQSNWLRFAGVQGRAFLNFLATPPPVLKWAYALGGIVLFVGGAALFMKTVKLQRELEQLRAEQLTLLTREQKYQQQMNQELESNKQLIQQLDRERQQRLELEKQLAALPSPQAATVSFVLTADLIRREAGEVKRLIIPKDFAFVQLRLVLETAAEYQSYRVVLETANGDRIWSEDIKSASAKTVVVRIPAKLFASDDYTITLLGLNTAGGLEQVGEYFFPVVKR